jgi:hypothetical protein
VSLVLAVLATPSAPSVPGRATSPWRVTRTVLVAPPMAAARGGQAELLGVDCPPGGGCVAVGDFALRSEVHLPMASRRVSNRWQRAVAIAPPRSGDQTAYASLSSVACADARTCVAVGTYTGHPHGARSGDQLPMAVVERAGVWQPAVALTLPPNAHVTGGTAGLPTAVWCTVTGRCTVIGWYWTRAGVTRGFRIAVELRAGVGGSVGRGVALPFAPLHGISPSASDLELYGLACVALGACLAVGQLNGVPVAQRETRRGWSTPLALPATTRTGGSPLVAVACAAATRCLAVGLTFDTLGPTGWTEAPAPSGGASARFNGVACSSPPRCVAVGDVGGSGPGAGTIVAVVAAGSTRGLRTTLLVGGVPNGGPGPASFAALNGVACTRSGVCTAVGTEGGGGGPHIAGFSHPIATVFSRV